MKSFLCIVISLIMPSVLPLGCHNISAALPIDQKKVEITPKTNCQALAQMVQQDSHLAVTNKEDPDAVWIEFTWSKTGDKNQHKLDCYYKRTNSLNLSTNSSISS